MFINYSNHPSTTWDEKQLKEAAKYGAIIDVPFPAVDPDLDEYGIAKMAYNEFMKIVDIAKDATDTVVVMIQGEFCLCHTMIGMLKSFGYNPMCACTQRNSNEAMLDGKSRFDFIRFRFYN